MNPCSIVRQPLGNWPRAGNDPVSPCQAAIGRMLTCQPADSLEHVCPTAMHDASRFANARPVPVRKRQVNPVPRGRPTFARPRPWLGLGNGIAHNASMSQQEDGGQAAMDCAREVGFDLAGIAPLAPPRDAQRFQDWLNAGHNAGMAYLQRDRERILDPTGLLHHRKGSLLVVGLAHSRPGVTLPGGGRIARYAAGRDYHNVVLTMLRKLRRLLRERGILGSAAHSRTAVDAAPLLERSHAAQAGLGFPSKAANLLHPRFGPWFFLGEIALELELEPTTQPPAGSCGTCRACIDACPTAAILEPGKIDAGRCISYLTIEHRGPIEAALRPQIGEWLFGCDVCSEVCPWGTAAPDLSQRFGELAPARTPLTDWLEPPDSPAWSILLRGSPLRRAGRESLARNAAIVLGNRQNPDDRAVLLRALSFDPSPVVREAAAWALGR